MEIQKIFANIENPEETLYSVLLSEEELQLFSDRPTLIRQTLMRDKDGKKYDLYEYSDGSTRKVLADTRFEDAIWAKVREKRAARNQK